MQVGVTGTLQSKNCTLCQRREAVKTPDSAARWRAGQQRAGNVTFYNANLPERLVSAPVYTVRVWDRKLGSMIAGIRQHFRPA
jgi:hypothetical protein